MKDAEVEAILGSVMKLLGEKLGDEWAIAIVVGNPAGDEGFVAHNSNPEAVFDVVKSWALGKSAN